jgi:hypothetical protein
MFTNRICIHSNTGCPTDLYSQILSKICDSESKVLLDTSSGIFDCLAVCKKVQCDVVIKVIVYMYTCIHVCILYMYKYIHMYIYIIYSENFIRLQ